jgi:CheY-like chemotaxis protein
MPHMDGLTYVRTLRRILPNIPVVISSGRMEEKDREEFKNLGVTIQLDKPFTEEQLTDVLKKIFSPEQPLAGS